MFAVAVLEHYSEAYPESAKTLGWLLRPRRRNTLLTEIGRFGKPRSLDDGALTWRPEDVSRLVAEALRIAELRPSTKVGVALLRARRRKDAENEQSTG